MQSLDLVLRRPASNLKLTVSKFAIAGAAVAALVLTPTLTTIAAPSAPPAVSIARHEDSPPIVPAGGSDADDEVFVAENDDDIDRGATPAEDEENGGGELESVDDAPADESQPPTLAIEGIMSSQVDLAWNQWTGAMDSRLVAPFITLPRPVGLNSEAIGLDADVTVREIVNGEMQTPADELEVSWYKETGAPNESGANMVFAGHLNWYNTPNAIFYNINELAEGDEIVVTAEDGAEYTYVVQWVELVETATADMDSIVGPTKKTSLTLITCGGEWDPSINQYKQRTVVRAEIKR